MSVCIMFRRCKHCGYRYTYNPSVGNFGIFCPKCKKGQSDVWGEGRSDMKRNIVSERVGKLAGRVIAHQEKVGTDSKNRSDDRPKIKERMSLVEKLYLLLKQKQNNV